MAEVERYREVLERLLKLNSCFLDDECFGEKNANPIVSRY